MAKPTLDEKGVVVACAHCGQKNRIPYGRLNQTGTCGQCQADLPAPNAPLDVGSEAQWKTLLTASPLPVVVDFWAPWCGPCRMVAPEMEKVAAVNSGRWLVVKQVVQVEPGAAQHGQPDSLIHNEGDGAREQPACARVMAVISPEQGRSDPGSICGMIVHGVI